MDVLVCSEYQDRVVWGAVILYSAGTLTPEAGEDVHGL